MIDKLKEECCGCGSCADICPHKAINFNKNKEGFLFPMIDETNCIKCNVCEHVCPILNKPKGNFIIESYAAYTLNKPSNSSSGGIFSVLASEILSQNGVIYGAAYDNNMYLRHIQVHRIEDLPSLCGSKYVQSDCIGIYKQVRKDLMNNKKVLFAGTPCQTAGLKNFLRKDYDNLIMLDLICHGVPSPGIFKDYLEFCSKLRKKRIKNFIIRDNRDGWNNHFKSTIIYSNKKEEYNSMLSNLWNRIFFSELAIRKSCEDCKFANKNRIGDISLGDFWGIENVNRNMYNKKGVSLILLNTTKGESLFMKLRDKIKAEVAYTNEKEHPNLYHSIKQDIRRTEFMQDYIHQGFSYIANKYFNYNKTLDFKIKLSILFNRYIKRFK